MIPARTAVTMVTANANLQTCAIRFTFGCSVRVSAGRLSRLAFDDEPWPKEGLGACVSNVMFELRLLPDGAASVDVLATAYEFEMAQSGFSYERYIERNPRQAKWSKRPLPYGLTRSRGNRIVAFGAELLCGAYKWAQETASILYVFLPIF
jgi:hypothetical protein